MVQNKNRFEFIKDDTLKKDLANAYEVLFDPQFDLVRYMTSISNEDMFTMVESTMSPIADNDASPIFEHLSSELYTLLSYSKPQNKHVSCVLFSMYEICINGFDTWKDNFNTFEYQRRFTS